MATKSPTNFHNYWGQYANEAALPDNTAEPSLEAGDTAYAIAEARTYTCTNPSTGAWILSDTAFETVGNITSVDAGDSAAAGTNATAARGDHQHAVSTGVVGSISPDDAAAEGSSTNLARADHTHAITTSVAVSVGTANAEGSASNFSRADHIHDAPAPTASDKSLNPTATSGSNYQTSGETITATPALDSYVRVFVNGMSYPLGDGDRDNVGDGTDNVACYFSGDSGTTARAVSAIVATDTLYWNAVHVGFDLEATDEVDFDYLV